MQLLPYSDVFKTENHALTYTEALIDLLISLPPNNSNIMATENPIATEDSPRSISPDGTAIGTPNEKRNGGIPEIDLVAAAALKPSRLRGRGLMFMVTFVAGSGVS
jgi:hypothetical protein